MLEALGDRDSVHLRATVEELGDRSLCELDSSTNLIGRCNGLCQFSDYWVNDNLKFCQSQLSKNGLLTHFYWLYCLLWRKGLDDTGNGLNDLALFTFLQKKSYQYSHPQAV